MHPAAVLQFERMIDEYNTWRAVPETGTLAGAGVVVGTRDRVARLVAAASRRMVRRARIAGSGDLCCRRGHLPRGAFAGQTSVPWPYDFPRKSRRFRTQTVRELHPQPSDDSAFQP